MARFLYRDQPVGRQLDFTKVASAPYTAALVQVPIDLEDALSESLQMAKMAWNASRKYPLIKRAFDQFYGSDLFQRVGQRLQQQAIKQASEACSIMPTPKPAKKHKPDLSVSLIPEIKQAAVESKVKILTDADVAITRNMPEESKKQILHHGYLVKDERTGEEVSIAYNTQVRQELTNPLTLVVRSTGTPRQLFPYAGDR